MISSRMMGRAGHVEHMGYEKYMEFFLGNIKAREVLNCACENGGII
jgi:hypothetical protein